MDKKYSAAQTELINSAAKGGPVAQRLMNCDMDVGVLKPWIADNGQAYQSIMINGVATAIPLMNAVATLKKDEWKQLDDAVLMTAKQRLIGVADLYSRNLVYRIGNGLAKTVLEYQDMSELTGAEMTMDAVTPSQKDRPEYDLKYLPLPIVHKDFSYNIRALAASRTGNMPLDTTTASLAAGVVADKVEGMLFNGASSFAYGGGTIYGYTDHPSKNDVTLSVNWDASAKTGELIVDDVRAMKQASIEAMHYGPFVLYIPTGYETVLDDDYKSTSDKTIRQRILEIDGVNEIKVADKLTANKVVLVQMTPDVVRIVDGLGMTTVEWQEGGGMTTNYKVMTIMVPQIRADQAGNCGVTVLSA